MTAVPTGKVHDNFRHYAEILKIRVREEAYS